MRVLLKFLVTPPGERDARKGCLQYYAPAFGLAGAATTRTQSFEHARAMVGPELKFRSQGGGASLPLPTP